MMARNGREPDASLYAGVDIGGTKIHAIVADQDGVIKARSRTKTKASEGMAGVMQRVEEIIAETCSAAGIAPTALDRVGVGVPSAVSESGRIVHAPNLGWQDLDFVGPLSMKLGLPVVAENDCNLGVLAEARFGAGRDAKSIVGFLVGTGLGGGIIIDGCLVRGMTRMAAEIGHMIVSVGGRKCGCGHLGCLEAYASKTGMARRIAHEVAFMGRETSLVMDDEKGGARIKSGQLAKAYRSGDAVAREALDECAHYLGIGIANIITLLGPEVIVIGGGVFEAVGDDLIDQVRQVARDHTFPAAAFAGKILVSKLGDDAVALGAVALAAESD